MRQSGARKPAARILLQPRSQGSLKAFSLVCRMQELAAFSSMYIHPLPSRFVHAEFTLSGLHFWLYRLFPIDTAIHNIRSDISILRPASNNEK